MSAAACHSSHQSIASLPSVWCCCDPLSICPTAHPHHALAVGLLCVCRITWHSTVGRWPLTSPPRPKVLAVQDVAVVSQACARRWKYLAFGNGYVFVCVCVGAQNTPCLHGSGPCGAPGASLSQTPCRKTRTASGHGAAVACVAHAAPALWMGHMCVVQTAPLVKNTHTSLSGWNGQLFRVGTPDCCMCGKTYCVGWVTSGRVWPLLVIVPHAGHREQACFGACCTPRVGLQHSRKH